MVLAAGTFFWLARALLRLAPALALLWPVKKIAAVVAMVGATAYCVFSGSDVATIARSIMTLVMFGAVLVDRPALSVRNLTIAALIVLAREPEALLGPSFQMSFGAVAALDGFRAGAATGRRIAAHGQPRSRRAAVGRRRTRVGLGDDHVRREHRDRAFRAPTISRPSILTASSATRWRCRWCRWSSCRRPSSASWPIRSASTVPSGR